MEDEDAIFAADDAARLDDMEAVAAAPDGAAEDELFEVELDGQVYTAPAALKGAFLRQADYTRKTQELAEQRRALEAEREEAARRANAYAGVSRDRLRLAALDDQLEAYQEIDWEAFERQDPEGARALWTNFQETGAAREQLAYAVAHHDERAQLKAAREHAEAMAETGRKLQAEIDGWSPDVAAKLVEYAQAFGVTLEELAEAADPRLWKLLHKAWKADEAAKGETIVQAHAVRPAVQVTGAGAGAGGVRDELSTKEWMRRRGEQLARSHR